MLKVNIAIGLQPVHITRIIHLLKVKGNNSIQTRAKDK